MSRIPRVIGDDIHYHLILRCNNKEHLLQDGEDFMRILTMLKEYKSRFNFKLYNYVLLNSHIHLMLFTHRGFFIDHVMHNFCLQYSKYFNKRHQRSGHFWAHRYRSNVILDDLYGLACLRYQHRNPIDVGLASKPEGWPWSGYNYYAFGITNDLIELHPSYLGLGRDMEQRRNFYVRLVNCSIPSDKFKNPFEGRYSIGSRRYLAVLKQIGRLVEKIKLNK